MKAMPKSLAVLFSVALSVFLVSCSHPIEIVGEGNVTSLSGDRYCYLEDFQAGEDNCTKNYVIGDYNETYYATPREGWQFHRWMNYCKNATDNQCSFNVPADAVQQFWGETVPPLRAVFIDPVIVDGKEWLQPNLFQGYTWEQISAVCPGGVCTGALPGSHINLTGYMWASVEDMNALFNHYIQDVVPGDPLLGPGPDEQNTSLEVFSAFLDAGWRRWVISCSGRGCEDEQEGFLGFTSTPFCFAYLIPFPGTAIASGLDGCDGLESPPVLSNKSAAWFYRPL